MKEGPRGFDFTTTHVDEFLVVDNYPKARVEELGSFFDLKTEGTPDYFLGNYHQMKENGMWPILSKNCTQLAL